MHSSDLVCALMLAIASEANDKLGSGNFHFKVAMMQCFRSTDQVVFRSTDHDRCDRSCVAQDLKQTIQIGVNNQ